MSMSEYDENKLSKEDKLNLKIFNKSITSFKSLVYMVEKEYGFQLAPGVINKFKSFMHRTQEECHDIPWYSFCSEILGFNTRQIALANIIYFLKTADNIFTLNGEQLSNDKVALYIGKYIREVNDENST